MPVTLLVNSGSQVILDYDYHELTLLLITAEKNAGQPRPQMIYQAYDEIFRTLSEQQNVNTEWIDIIEDPENEGEPKLEYSLPAVVGATILGAWYESTILDERVDTQIAIDTEAGIVTVNLGGVAIGGKIKITYKS